MQSLVLLSSLVLNTPVSISNLSDTQNLQNLVKEQVTSVQKHVSYKAKQSIMNSDFLQAKQIFKLAKQTTNSTDSMSE
ncbi:hypothetical protein N9L48_04475 [Psychrosphaera sp.]|nr:hypothetical protein [Psychrosphaera sp.]